MSGLSISKSTRIGQSYRRIGTSVQIPGDYLEIHQTIDQFHCALLCNMNSSCKMFSQKENDCKLYNSSSSSGLCYEVAVGPMISLGEDIYIPQIWKYTDMYVTATMTYLFARYICSPKSENMCARLFCSVWWYCLGVFCLLILF